MVASRISSDNNITGSWHNSGYYGHFRSKVRNDFMNEYRQRAKPTPPTRYIERSSAPVRKHLFSKHDSRERYKDNALYFVDGNGRRQVHGASFHYKPDFIAWMPHKSELLDKRQPLTSMYKTTYHKGINGFGEDPFQQKYSSTISNQAAIISQKFDCFDEKAAYTDGYMTEPKKHFQTIYRNVHNTIDPRAEEARAINTLCTRSANSQRIERARSAKLQRETVASCMSWTASRPRTTVPETAEAVSVDIQRIGSKGPAATPLIPPQAPHSTCSTNQLPPVNNVQPVIC